MSRPAVSRPAEPALNPTGEQYEISHGEQRAVVTEVGAALRIYDVAGRAVLAGFAADEVVSGGRGQTLLPWPNRIRDGRYSFDGRSQQLVLSEPARHNAIHGLARHVPWRLQHHEPDRVSLRVRIYPQPGWPGVLEAQLTYSLSEEGLRVEVAARNLGTVALPFGYAAHPYLTVGEQLVDEITVTVPAASYLVVDERQLPVELAVVGGTAMDLRQPSLIGDRVFDTPMTDLARERDGRWWARLQLGDRHAELWAGPELGWTQVFTGNTRRDVSLAIEPMTCGPDAFNPGPTQDGLIRLEPGADFSCQWGISGG